MYLLINDKKYTCSDRKYRKGTVKFLGVTPAPEEISGVLQLFSDSDFLLSRDVVSDYKYIDMKSGTLTLSNHANHFIADMTTTPQYRIQKLELARRNLEEENKIINERLAESDEIAIDLYEASLANESINAEQDEAIIDIYELMEGLING